MTVLMRKGGEDVGQRRGLVEVVCLGKVCTDGFELGRIFDKLGGDLGACEMIVGRNHGLRIYKK